MIIIYSYYGAKFLTICDFRRKKAFARLANRKCVNNFTLKKADVGKTAVFND